MTSHTPSIWKDREFLFLFLSSLAAFIVESLDWFGFEAKMLWFAVLSGIFCLVVGQKVLLKGIKAIFSANFSSISLLVTIAMVGAFFLREYTEAAVVISLFALGEKLEDFGISSSKAALKMLAEKTPKQIDIIGRGLIPIEDVKIDEVMIVKAGSVLGLDGVVLKGSGLIDESSLTGEPLPKARQENASVFSGTLLTNGYLEVRVTKTSKDSTLARIIEMTSKATSEKAVFQRFIERFAKFYTPSVLVGALLIFLIPVFVLSQDMAHWLEQALTILVISCPCALVISTPISIFAAVGNAASQGVLIKGGRYLETLSKIDTIAMDKTRTITLGKPTVTDVIALNSLTDAEVLACAAGIEALSEHPLAVSIVEDAKRRNLSPHSAGHYETILGKGAKAECYVCQDKEHFIGSRSLAVEKLTLPPNVEAELSRLSAEGKTNVLIWTAQSIEGIVSLLDQTKPEALESLNRLRAFGVNVIMLTGDSAEAARAIAKEVGIDEFHAGLLPQDKARLVKQWVSDGKVVAMIGDGVNDAPALASASVGIAMGAAGSDVAIETAHVALMNDRLDLLPFLVGLARTTWKTIRFNAILAVVVKLTVLGLAVVGRASLTLAIFSDVLLLIFVVFFSLRLLKWRSVGATV